MASPTHPCACSRVGKVIKCCDDSCLVGNDLKYFYISVALILFPTIVYPIVVCTWFYFFSPIYVFIILLILPLLMGGLVLGLLLITATMGKRFTDGLILRSRCDTQTCG
jgi:hypothetical protein